MFKCSVISKQPKVCFTTDASIYFLFSKKKETKFVTKILLISKLIRVVFVFDSVNPENISLKTINTETMQRATHFHVSYIYHEILTTYNYEPAPALLH